MESYANVSPAAALLVAQIVRSGVGMALCPVAGMVEAAGEGQEICRHRRSHSI